jgi:hypothetical protein
MNRHVPCERAIERLQIEVEQLQERIQAVRRYLLSAKFHTDPTVQVRDVLHRLDSEI